MAFPVTPSQRFDRIADDAMCIGCGICESLAGERVIRMQRVANGSERPVVKAPLSHETVDRILDICPGTRVEGLPAAEVNANTRHDLVWGAWQRMALAHATDPDVRFRGSTAGVLTALGMYLIDSGEVEFIVHANASTRFPGFGDRAISTSARAVLESAGSRYGPTAPLRDIHAQLDRGRPFAFIGKPCDVAALRNLAREDKRVDQHVHYMLTMVCGGFMPPVGMARFLRNLDIDEGDVRTIRYRGYGCPGPTRIELHDGRVVEKRYTDFWGTDESMWVLPFRCKVCPDGIGESADIAAADTWPGGSPDPATEDEDKGMNAVIVRTNRGLTLIEKAIAAGYLTITEDTDPRYMDSIQPHQRNKKYNVGSRHEGLRAEGKTTPRTARLRLDALTGELSDEQKRLQRDGTRKRVRAGTTS